jgi:hypothetical protein
MKFDYRLNEYLLFIEAWIGLAFARFLTACFPFRIITRMMNTPVRKRRKGPPIEIEGPLISTAIRRAGRKSPWRTMCFEQALAAGFLLRRRGREAIITFGVCKLESGKINAHAWLDCENTRITGGEDIQHFEIIAVFRS